MADMIKNGFDPLPQYEDGNKVHHLYLDESQIADGCILTSNLERTEVIKNTFDTAEKQSFHHSELTRLI